MCWDGKCGFVNPSGSLRLKETEWARYSRSSDHGACWDDDGLPRTFGVPHQTKFTPACQGKPTAQTAAVIGPHGNQGGLSERDYSRFMAWSKVNCGVLSRNLYCDLKKIFSHKRSRFYNIIIKIPIP